MPPKTPKAEKRDASPLSLRAAMQPGSLNGEKRTVDLTWTTGAAVLRRDWDGSYLEELSTDPAHVRMGRLNNGAPFLADHNGYDVSRTLGVVESARLENGTGVATVRFAPAGIDPDADMVFEKIRAGIVQNVSVGYRVHKFEKTEGTDGKVPTYRATDWEPYEISAVAMGADDGAGFRSLTRGAEPQQEQRQMEKTPEQLAAEKAAEDQKRAAEIAAATDAALKTERARGLEIRNLCARHKALDGAFADALVAKGGTLEQARAAVLDALAERSATTEIDGHSGVEVTVEERDKTRLGAEAALFQRYGMTDMVRKVRAKGDSVVPEAVAAFRNVASDPGEFGGMRLTRIAQEFLERSGRSTRRMSDKQIIDAALERRSGGQNTESDFSVLLANLMYKQSLGQYALADDTWRRFCGTDTVQDFRNSNRYRIGTFGVLDAVPEGAEYKSTTIPDGQKFAINVATKGKKLAISRQALIDDDMGAVMATAGEFGRMAGLTIEKDVFALLNDNSGLGFLPDGSTPFFDSALNANVNSTGSALAVDALDADRVVMSQLKDISGNEFLNLRPSVLLVHVGIEGKAKVINRMEYDGAANTFQVPNKVQGLFRDIVGSPRLTSTTRRYLFTDGADALKVVFLNGVQAPFLEQRLGFDVDGIEWKIRLDFKAQWFDPRGAVTNAGQ